VGIGRTPFWYNYPNGSSWGPNLHVHEGAEFVDIWIGNSQDTVGKEIGSIAFVGHGSNIYPLETKYAGITAEINNSGMNYAGSLLFYTATGEGLMGDKYKEQMRISPSGNIGIGTQGPGSKLTVDGDVEFLGSRLNVNQDGEVGIGINNPTSWLHLHRPDAHGGTKPMIKCTNSLSGTSNLDGIELGYWAEGTVDAYLINYENGFLSFGTNGYDKMRIMTDGKIGIGTITPGFKLDVNGDINYTGNLYNNGSLLTPGLWSKSGSHIYYNTGNVGIGTSTPQGLVDIQSGDSPTDALFVKVSGSTTNGGIIIHQSSTYAWQQIVSNTNNSSYGDLKFQYVNRTSPGTVIKDDVLVLKGSGNVGIGTSAPTEKLEVIGTIKATSFTGNGSTLANLNAANISSGTLNNSRFNALSDLGGGSGTTFLRKDGSWASPASTTYSAGNDLNLSGTTFSLDNDIDVNYLRATGSSGLKLFDDGGKGIYIRDGGNVGIGVPNPEYAKLCIHTGIDAGIKFTNDGTGPYYSDGFLLSWISGGNSDVVLWNRENTSIVFATNNSEKVRIKENGYVGIGTPSPGYKLHVNGTAYATGAAGALSDIRHKKNIQSFGNNTLEIVGKLRPVSYEWKNPLDNGMQGVQFGFIAQEVEEILPSVVLTEDNDERTKALKYSEFIPVLVKAIQELKTENETLKARIEKLEDK